MKFTNGQLYFAIFYFILFSIAMVWSYAKDKKHQNLYYKNIWKVALAIIVAIALFTGLTFWIHK